MNGNVSSKDVWFLLGFGFAIWLIATVAFRLVGQVLISPDTPYIIAGLFVVTIPAMVLLTIGAFRWRAVDSTHRPLAAILLVTPGMVLDAIVLPFFGTVFPNMVVESAQYFGGFLLLAYVLALLVGLFSGR
ncbi:DUF5367 family protein [Halostagnicola sp. A-GB9-2]|uniref:DUF5367 family protein n=1 Tax=Halostagnicola sp. A-GB9-2 TaxID=3048066 RepID=UPI0024BFBAF3|nr:DUF5367 family protein [Halostagnicola sp. A-GB9-2]MDJ1430687.1 DUF5367 family protein [Halostagnicola sp. A-GB9-2]